ncbi:MAG: ABC transporter permease [Abitibacteriaceae bacterium]|nr:ABC transporter permease [Abditibacteriaceae bacterium]MBV9868490.1 ABC transporter permease [Abditibacteriaceae bacterium]
MLRYVIRRVLYGVPILIGVSLVTFFLFYVASPPEQIARRNLSAKNPTPQQIHQWLEQHGYDKPLREQFSKHMSELFLLRFGNSDANGEPIWDHIKAGAGPSLMLMSQVFLAGIIAEICVALFAAYFRGTYVDYWITFLCVLLMSIVYLVYIIAGQYLLGKVLKYFPLAGYRGGLTAWKFILLPTVVGVITGLGGGVRLFRTFMLDEINQDYVRTARAKGASEQTVLFRHVLKNAAIPIITTSVAAIPFLFIGSVLLESFFGIPGLGGYTRDAIDSQDFAVVRAMVFLGTLLTIVGYILTDICYALVDPRVRLE